MKPKLRLLCALPLASPAALHAADAPAQKPNILVIPTDDLARAAHAIFVEQKTGLNVLVFGDSADFRHLKVAK